MESNQDITLGEALPKEIARVRDEVLPAYYFDIGWGYTCGNCGSTWRFREEQPK